MKKIETPELDKLNACWDEMRPILDFLESSGYILAEYEESGYWHRLQPAVPSTMQIVYEYFGLDSAKVEQERRALIASICDDADSYEVNQCPKCKLDIGYHQKDCPNN